MCVLKDWVVEIYSRRTKVSGILEAICMWKIREFRSNLYT